jgi:hypothetical protein
MPEPRILVCDTDALIQFFLTKHITGLVPLRVLKDNYQIQPAIIEEVEVELAWTRKFGSQFEPELRKALATGTIQLLNEAAFHQYVPPHLAKTVFSSFQALGLEHNKYVDPGEAYTLAAAATLSEPALSNDVTALRALENNGFALPSPVLRPFDLLALCFQTGTMTETECNAVRQELVRVGEHVPRPFRRASFTNGLANFCPRLLESGVPITAKPAAQTQDYTRRILVTRKP